MFRKLLDQGQAGDNVGVLLRGTKKDEVERGQVLAKPKSINPHRKFMGEVYVLLHMECELKCKVCPYWGQRGACRDRGFREAQFRSFDLDRLKSFIDEVPYEVEQAAEVLGASRWRIIATATPSA